MKRYYVTCIAPSIGNREKLLKSYDSLKEAKKDIKNLRTYDYSNHSYKVFSLMSPKVLYQEN